MIQFAEHFPHGRLVVSTVDTAVDDGCSEKADYRTCNQNTRNGHTHTYGRIERLQCFEHILHCWPIDDICVAYRHGRKGHRIRGIVVCVQGDQRWRLQRPLVDPIGQSDGQQ